MLNCNSGSCEVCSKAAKDSVTGLSYFQYTRKGGYCFKVAIQIFLYYQFKQFTLVEYIFDLALTSETSLTMNAGIEATTEARSCEVLLPAYFSFNDLYMVKDTLKYFDKDHKLSGTILKVTMKGELAWQQARE